MNFDWPSTRETSSIHIYQSWINLYQEVPVRFTLSLTWRDVKLRWWAIFKIAVSYFADKYAWSIHSELLGQIIICLQFEIPISTMYACNLIYLQDRKTLSQHMLNRDEKNVQILQIYLCYFFSGCANILAVYAQTS